MEVLKILTELDGISGNEEKIAEFIQSELTGVCDKIKVDKLGNIIAFKKGANSSKKIMISAHMDEVGLIVVGHTAAGEVLFKNIGGFDPRILPNQRIRVYNKDVKGVIGCKAIHLQSLTEKKSIPKIENLCIDIGAKSKAEAEEIVPLGEYIAFDSDYVEFGDNSIKAKALDDRIGCAIMIDILKSNINLYFDLYCCFTVQEEIGLRGSKVTTNKIKPDLALVIEGTTCADIPAVKSHDISTKINDGAALTIRDRVSYTDKRLLNFIVDIAKKYNIKYQYKRTTAGGNDAGRIQKEGEGVIVASISVPCKYIHTPVSVMSKNDYNAVKELTIRVIQYIGKFFSKYEI